LFASLSLFPEFYNVGKKIFMIVLEGRNQILAIKAKLYIVSGKALKQLLKIK